MGSCVPLSPIQFSTVYLHFINTLLLLTPRAGTRSFCPRYFPINGTNQSCYYHDDPYLPTRLLGYLCCMLSRSVPQKYLFPHTSSLIPAFIWNSTFICSTTSSLGVHVLEVIFFLRNWKPQNRAGNVNHRLRNHPALPTVTTPSPARFPETHGPHSLACVLSPGEYVESGHLFSRTNARRQFVTGMDCLEKCDLWFGLTARQVLCSLYCFRPLFFYFSLLVSSK